MNVRKLQAPGLLLALVMLWLSVAPGAFASAGVSRAVTGPSQATMGPPDSSVAGATSNSADYRIGPQDLLEVSVFQVAELNRTVRVNTGGDVSLPLIGVIHAGGRTVHEVEAAITEKLASSFLQNPQVSVFVKEFTSQRVTLEGALSKPGIYPLTGQTSLLQAIAMAQGLSDLADPKAVMIFRMIDGKKQVALFDLKLIRKGKAQDPLIYGDDIVVVEESGSKSMFSRLIKAMPMLNIFTPF